MSEGLQETGFPTVYEWHAKLLEEAAKNLAFWVSTTSEDRLGWQPKAEGEDSKARTIYDQIHECAQVNRRMASLLSGAKPGEWIADPSYGSGKEAQHDLKVSTAELAAVVRRLDDGALERDYPGRNGPVKGSFLLSLSLGNMYYHGGQINQIQLLYGDEEFRFPDK